MPVLLKLIVVAQAESVLVQGLCQQCRLRVALQCEKADKVL